jgi:predicted Fe-Mo cluster-binding NifX family protein
LEWAWVEGAARDGDGKSRSCMSELDKELERIRQKKLEEILQNFKKKGGGQMSARIVIPVVDETGLDARLSEHFGRTPYFAVVELDENGQVANQRTVPNVGHFGGSGQRADNILQLKPNAIITYGMGPRGLSIYQSVRVAVLRANANTVREVIAAYNRDELEELTEGCHQARHR